MSRFRYAISKVFGLMQLMLGILFVGNFVHLLFVPGVLKASDLPLWFVWVLGVVGAFLTFNAWTIVSWVPEFPGENFLINGKTYSVVCQGVEGEHLYAVLLSITDPYFRSCIAVKLDRSVSLLPTNFTKGVSIKPSQKIHQFLPG